MEEEHEKLVAQVTASIEALDVPDELRVSIERHQRNLTQLAASLIAAGCERSLIEKSLETAFESYKKELINAILQMRGGECDQR